jgi:hypothetical protein
MHEVIFNIKQQANDLKNAKQWRRRQNKLEEYRAKARQRLSNQPLVLCEICNRSYKKIDTHRKTTSHIIKAANPFEEASKGIPIVQTLMSKNADDRNLIGKLRDKQKKDMKTIESLVSKVSILENQIDTFLH